MWIGVVSDTQDGLHPSAIDVFEGMDYILHCGGIGSTAVLEELSNVAPTVGVIGTDDPALEFQPLTTTLLRRFGDVPIFVTHDVGSPMRPHRNVLAAIEDGEPKVLLFGSTRKPFNTSLDERLWFNPGSAGFSAGGAGASVGILEIDGQVVRGEIVELPRR